jgi:hypothetical protein
MAVIIGRTKGWLWWLGGLVCAIVFGSRAQAAAAKALYGVRPRPPQPRIDEKSVTAAQKDKADKLVDEWMAGGKPAAPSAAEKEQIAKLIESFGSGDFRVRETASREIVRFGGKALPQLEEARKSSDAEVRTRAEAAVNSIKSGAGGEQVVELRKIRAAAHVVITARRSELQKKTYQLMLEARKLKGEGKDDESAAKLKESRVFSLEAGKLSRLYNLVVYGASFVPGPARPKYGVMIRPLPGVIEGRVQGGAAVKKEAEKAKAEAGTR